jgi:hypothetical protein
VLWEPIISEGAVYRHLDYKLKKTNVFVVFYTVGITQIILKTVSSIGDYYLKEALSSPSRVDLDGVMQGQHADCCQDSSSYSPVS